MGKTWFLRLSRAAKDTSWLAWKRQVSVAVLSGFMSFFWLHRYGIEKNLIEQTIIIVCVVLAAVVIVPFLEFCNNFIKAPIRIAQDEISQLKDELEKTRKEFGQTIAAKDLKINDLSRELSEFKNTFKAPDLTFEPNRIQDSLVTPQGARVGRLL